MEWGSGGVDGFRWNKFRMTPGVEPTLPFLTVHDHTLYPFTQRRTQCGGGQPLVASGVQRERVTAQHQSAFCRQLPQIGLTRWG
jgi:hypothetical protein